MKYAILVLLLLSLLLCALYPMVKTCIPNFSRQGVRVLIDLKDTGVIMREEKPLPEWIKRKREITVQYKDKLGIYHTEEFTENQITEIQ